MWRIIIIIIIIIIIRRVQIKVFNYYVPFLNNQFLLCNTVVSNIA